MRKFGAIVFGLLLTGGTTQVACSPCSVHGRTPIEFTGGLVNEARTIYQSGTVHGEMLHFPEGRRYDFYHGLGVVPVTIHPFLSFKERLEANGDPDDKTKPNNVSPAAGNQVVIEVQNDQIIRVRNDTCAEFYLRIVALANPDDVTALEGAAGASSN